MLSLWTLLVACKHPAPQPAEPVTLEPSPLVTSQASHWYLRARVAEARGDVAEAQRSLEWVVRLDRGSPFAWMAMARFRLRQAHLPEAFEALEQARARLDGPLPTLDLLEARVALAAGRGEEALAHALPLLDDEAVGHDAAEVALDAADRACQREAVWEAFAARADRPGWAGLVLEIADRVGDDVLAAQVAEAVALRDPDPTRRALGWKVLGRPARAAVAWEIAGDRARAGEAFLEAGQPERALALTRDPDDPTVGWVRAGALEVLGRPDEAEAVVRETAAVVEDAALRVARLRVLRGDREGALEALEGARTPAARQARAVLLAEDDPEAAVVLWRGLVTEAPDRVDAWLGLAVHAGDAEAATWVVDLAACDDVAALRSVAPLLSPCDGAEALRRALGARPADEGLREAWSEAAARCEAESGGEPG